ncbi:MAG: 7-cyano-7-deazaguanine synthase QueC [candidate division WOR-3 bacterium]|jgi:7-cyano-7-deazaguanine synthase
MKPKSIILLSGGLDSTVSATIAKRRTQPLFALTLDYGQRAAKMEIAASKKICRFLQIEHKTIRLPFFKEFKGLMLVGRARKGLKKSRNVRDLWIPNRNALFINIAACFAEYYSARIVVTGFNREEAQEFPDNSVHFLRAINRSLRLSTLGRVEVRSYVLKYTKKEIYRLGVKSKAPLELVYSCYLGGKSMCGKCASCRRLIKASKQ